MDLLELIRGLSRPEAWPRPPARVELVQTHASAVFLGDDEVYKLKKPVNFGFLDYSTLEKRRRACEAEVRLNRRLAPEVYLGVEPITAGPRFGGEGEPLDWAVRMKRLPEECTFRSRLERDELDCDLVVRFARLLAGFYERAEAGSEVQDLARFAIVERNCLENFEQGEAQVGRTVTREVFDRFLELTKAELAGMRDLVETRCDRGLAREGHGDLRLDHAYLLPDDELVVVDCIEFNERFRYQDPVCDIAFFAMELAFAGRRELARSFTEAFFEATADAEGRALLPLSVAYRHAVRAKVRGIQAGETEIPADERRWAQERSRAHWLAGLAELSAPAERGCLVLVGGPPASGKSTLARSLSESAGLLRISSDETRKRLAGLAPEDDGAAAPSKGIYSPEWTERTYAECLRLACDALERGGRVLVDATFREDARRLRFLDAARALGLRALWLECELDPQLAVERLRSRGADTSDATLEVQRQARASWEPPSRLSARARCGISTAASADEALDAAGLALANADLACGHST